MTSPTRELRHVVRKLVRSPGFTLIAILTLAVGIGANTAIFSVVDGVLLRPLPYPDAEELVGLWHAAPGIGLPQFEQSNTTYTLYREQNRSFEEIAISSEISLNLTGSGDPVRISAASATPSLLAVLRISPALGRGFTEEEAAPGGPNVAMISDGLWKTRYGADPEMVGKTIELDDEAWEVVGVLPPGFAYPGTETDAWIPHVIRPEDLGRANFSHEGIARLKPGVTVEAATNDLNQLLARLPQVYPGEINAGMMEQAQMSAHVNPMKDDIVGDIGSVLWILFGTVGFVLIIACANVANLFLVRAEGRQRELAVRTALGAGRGDLIRAYLSESTILSLIGGTVGVGLALVGVRALIAVGPESLPRIGEVGLYGSVLIFTAAISLVSGLLFGAIPVLKYGRPNLATALKEGGRGGSVGRERHRANNALVATQVALALMLLVGSGLMARSFFELGRVDPGFEPDGVLTFSLSLPGLEPGDSLKSAAFYQQLADNIRGLPGVEAVGGVSNLPMTGGQSNDALIVEDFPVTAEQVPPIMRTNVASPGYFEAMGVRLLEGRTFERRDHETVTRAAVVSRALARRFWPNGSPIGKRVSPTLPTADEPLWFTIVGVVDDVRDDGLAQEAPGMVYYPMTGYWTVRSMSLAVRTRGDPLGLAAAVRDEVWGLNPTLPIANIRPATELTRDSAARTTFTMVMLGIAAAVALLLGTIGVYGVISYVVSQRTREFGIRMALGAADGDIRGMVVRQGLLVAGIGVAVGIAGGLLLTRLMKALLFGVSTTDPLTFAAVALLLLAVSALAAYLPARRASGVNPVEALHCE